MTHNRTTFATKLGVIAAAVGSAVGLGNIWRFPYEVGQSGGGAFLLVYLLCVALLGIPLITAEFVIGRASRTNVARAFKKLAPGSPWGIIGYLSVLAPFLILCYYTIIAGWTIEYLYQALTNGFAGKSPEVLKNEFVAFSTGTWQPIIWIAIFMAANYAIIVGGVKKGIERASNVMMPLLFVLLVVFCINSFFLPGGGEGFRFFLQPDFSKLTPAILLRAMGQAFFSLSLAMGCLVTYSSYFGDETRLGKTAATVAWLDTLVAVMAGIMIFPAVFSFGISPTAGPDLVYITLPNVFMMMPGGYIWAVLFFILLALAALTSTVSLFEVVTAFMIEEYHMSRRRALGWVLGSVFVLAVVCSLSLGPWNGLRLFGMDIFDIFDYVSANILLPVGGLLISLFVGYKLDRNTVYRQVTNDGRLRIGYFKPLMFLLRYFCPIAIALIFLSGLGLF